MKKTVVLAAMAVLALGMAGCAPKSEPEVANEQFEMQMKIGDPNMVVNGVEKEIDPGRGTAPQIYMSRVVAPVRAAVEEMGGKVEWEQNTQTVTLTKGETAIELQIDSDTAKINGEKEELDAPPTIINGRTMLPIRYVAEGFGYRVNWDEENKLITVLSIDTSFIK